MLTWMIWLSLVRSLSCTPPLLLSVRLAMAAEGAPTLSVYESGSRDDLEPTGCGSLELLVRSGLVVGLLAGVVLRGDALGS